MVHATLIQLSPATGVLILSRCLGFLCSTENNGTTGQETYETWEGGAAVHVETTVQRGLSVYQKRLLKKKKN